MKYFLKASYIQYFLGREKGTEDYNLIKLSEGAFVHDIYKFRGS